jgi:DNA polymerase-3 subunit epsilon
MKICIIDTETTGLDHEKDSVIEIAYARYHFTENEFSLIECGSTLVTCDENPAESVNHISPELTKMRCSSLNHVLDAILCSDYVVAHNAAFDKPFVEDLFRFYSEDVLNKAWVCTLEDYEWDEKESRKLAYLCNDRNLVCTIGKHRGMIDVLMLAELIAHEGFEKFGKAVDRSGWPRYNVVAQVSYADREKAKEKKFRWCPDTKTWEREIRALREQDVHAMFDFPVITRVKERRDKPTSPAYLPMRIGEEVLEEIAREHAMTGEG